MQGIFILALAGLTSVGAYFFGIGRLGLSSGSFGAAIGKMLEAVGTTLVFLAVNLAMAVTIVLAVRGVTGSFVSVYVTDDAVWMGLSLLQGLTFQWWRGLSGKPR
ncbi:MAG: hypothetical protein DMD99_19190 [Candidatus Rokuibacteriota bacterium]|nr:MAG: hypothetical protein DMD99_19190 [Candidatus Rokubacteria bacterium]